MRYQQHKRRGDCCLFCLLKKARPYKLMCAGDCKFSSPCMKMRENTVRLMDNIESKQYTATGAGIWLNSCIEITLYDKIVFSEISIGLCWHHNAIILSCLPPEMDPVWPTCRKAVTRCDVSVLGDCTWALTPPGELTQRPQYCILLTHSMWFLPLGVSQPKQRKRNM